MTIVLTRYLLGALAAAVALIPAALLSADEHVSLEELVERVAALEAEVEELTEDLADAEARIDELEEGGMTDDDDSDEDEKDDTWVAGDGTGNIVLCHKGKTIRVGAAAVRAHLAHGDTLGRCAGTGRTNMKDRFNDRWGSNAEVRKTIVEAAQEIREAIEELHEAAEEGADVDEARELLRDARELYRKARRAYATGDMERALAYAQDAEHLADKADTTIDDDADEDDEEDEDDDENEEGDEGEGEKEDEA